MVLGAAAAAAVFTVLVSPPDRQELIDIDAELREHYKAASEHPDGRTKRGRPTKHDMASRRWIDTVGFPVVQIGKRFSGAGMAMLRLRPRSSLRAGDWSACA